MSRELDVRNFNRSKVTPGRITELHALAASAQNLPGVHSIRIEKFDNTTGNPAIVVSEGAVARDGDYIQRAIEHVQAISPALGLTDQAPEFTADAAVQDTSSGAKAVNLQQRYKGIPIFQSATTVQFGPNGALNLTVGSTITVLQDTPVNAKLSVQEAVLKASQHVAKPQPDEIGKTDQFGQALIPAEVEMDGFTPKIRATFPGIPEQPTVLEPGPFGAEIRANLVWFPLDEGIKLAWEILLTMPNYDAQYSTLVDAQTGDILYCRQLVQYVVARGNVYHVNPAATPRQVTDFPVPFNDHGLPFPAQAQSDWRWCHKCQGLYFAGNPGSHCPVEGAHENVGSGNYSIVQNSPAYPGQSNWRWCHKCQGLYFAGNPGSHCPAGGAHENVGSGNYTLLNQLPLAPGQHGWRWCHKCQGLYFGANAGSRCPAGGAHDNAGSGDYSLISFATTIPAAFPDT